MTPDIMSECTRHCGTTRAGQTVAALCLALGLGVHAASAQFSDAPPYLVPAASFNLDGSVGTDYQFSFEGGYIYQSGTETTCLHAPVYLPDAFRIGEFVLHGYSSGSAVMSVGLARLAWGSTSSETLAEVVTSGNSGILSPTDDSLVGATVENDAYFYFLNVCMPGSASTNLRLYAVRINACVDPDLVVDATEIAGGDDFTACSVLTTTGAVSVASGRAVEFVAGSRIALSNGFEVQSGAGFIAGLDPDLVPPPAARAAAAR